MQRSDPVDQILRRRKLTKDFQTNFCRAMRLGKSGIAARAETTLAQIAAERGVAPSVVYQQMTTGLDDAAAHLPAASGSGYGRKSVEELAVQLRVPLNVALDRLRQHGVIADADSNVRAVAIAHGKLPTDLAAVITAP